MRMNNIFGSPGKTTGQSWWSSNTPNHAVVAEKRRNSQMMQQNRERFALQKNLRSRINQLSQKKKYRPLFTKTIELKDFLSFKEQFKPSLSKASEKESSDSFEADVITERSSSASNMSNPKLEVHFEGDPKKRNSSALGQNSYLQSIGAHMLGTPEPVKLPTYHKEQLKSVEGCVRAFRSFKKPKETKLASKKLASERERELMQRREASLRHLLDNEKVVVFNRNVLKPWDGIPRLDFLDCNLKAAMNEEEEYQSTHTELKDRFIGAIN